MNSFSNRIWWTKKSRIVTERRLLQYDFYSQLILLWYSFFLVAASIYDLKSSAKNVNEPVVMVALSVLVLVFTLFVNNRNFKGRAMLVKQCYEQLSIVYTKAKKAEESSGDLIEIDKEYQNILSISENHSEQDYYIGLVSEYKNTPEDKRNELSKTPTESQIDDVNFRQSLNYVLLGGLIIFPFVIYFYVRG